MNDNSFAARTRRYELANGLTLLVLENPTNPTVSLSGYLVSLDRGLVARIGSAITFRRVLLAVGTLPGTFPVS